MQPVAALIGREPTEEGGEGFWHLAPGAHLIGRARESDLRLGGDARLSRKHASLHWTGRVFEISDEGGRNGTRVNGRALEPGERASLAHGDRISLGGLDLVFRAAYPGSAGAALPYGPFMDSICSMSSLDPATVVHKALDLLRLASGVQRAYLVGAGRDAVVEPLLTPLEDPSLHISRSLIEEVFRLGRKQCRFVNPAGGDIMTSSMRDLDLRRIWVSPIMDIFGSPMAAVYLDSADPGEAFDEETERLLDAVVQQIGMALRNSALHAEVLSLNENLEHKVAERTRELEDSRARLIGQDRLAILGKLVAAIAHELNNPVGAMASLSQTVKGLQQPILKMGEELKGVFKTSEDAAALSALMDATLRAAEGLPQDTRSRRALETEHRRLLEQDGIPAGDAIARRLAKAQLTQSDIKAALPLLRREGERLSAMIDQLHTFGRGLQTIKECGANVARIVDGLKTYAHLDRAEFEVANVHRGIEATLSVLGPRIPKGVRVETRFDTIEPFAHRPGELTQVWTNLVDNGLRAMGETGELRIETRDRGGEVEVTVQDSGCGVPEEMRGRIFELDATTRGPGAGLGLGLPICRTIVEKNHGGQITFESVPGRTVFLIRLPKKPPEREVE